MSIQVNELEAGVSAELWTLSQGGVEELALQAISSAAAFRSATSTCAEEESAIRVGGDRIADKASELQADRLEVPELRPSSLEDHMPPELRRAFRFRDKARTRCRALLLRPVLRAVAEDAAKRESPWPGQPPWRQQVVGQAEKNTHLPSHFSSAPAANRSVPSRPSSAPAGGRSSAKQVSRLQDPVRAALLTAAMGATPTARPRRLDRRGGPPRQPRPVPRMHADEGDAGRSRDFAPTTKEEQEQEQEDEEEFAGELKRGCVQAWLQRKEAEDLERRVVEREAMRKLEEQRSAERQRRQELQASFQRQKDARLRVAALKHQRLELAMERAWETPTQHQRAPPAAPNKTLRAYASPAPASRGRPRRISSRAAE